MLRSHRRTVLAAAALAATTLLLTGCQDGADARDSARPESPSATASSAAAGADGSSDSTGSPDSGAQPGDGSGSGAKGTGVTGTWFGNVSYLAPGKYTVSDMKGTEQAFFTSTDTDIEGAGVICGDADGQAATRCDEDQLAAASKKGVSATVKLKNGIAVSIVEDHAGGGGSDDGPNTGKVNGTRSGELGYLAPGKYTLKDSDGATTSFYSATATTINGDGWICGEAGGDLTRCTEGDLEAAAKKGGVRVVVELDNGAAVTIDEEHN
ncbi:hypothetical protein GTW43_26465 [Streptomyces sp. SID5785]|uniref:hypothetical protein n=1 Tax=Streptomyces sp. SID5785 TaxID=2690309 RepID=UPI00136150BF|nr:hypothetical protein [Streptomyces sp. SID5785]MZD07966.1 hypothetical protein [Streptomyces sp. SID5785]MZD08597.1 hypothetical protein [Streptomyces sp. SID5785]